MDAVKELAGKAGLDVPAQDPRMRDQAERSADLTDVMAAAQAWFAEQLQGIDGGEARRYLDAARDRRRDRHRASASASPPTAATS